MYGMFDVESLAVEINGGENRQKKYLHQAFSAWCRYSDQIANIYIYIYIYICTSHDEKWPFCPSARRPFMLLCVAI
jgi:hypothetical protein